MLNTLKRLVIEEEGQGMAEYALILAFIAVACIAAFQFLKVGIDSKVREVGTELEQSK